MSRPARQKSKLSASVLESPDTAPIGPTSETSISPQSSEPARPPAASSESEPAATPSRENRPGGKTRLGIYFGPAEFEQIRAAYLADWQHGGEADTFTKWIAAAIEAHAERTPEERASYAHAVDTEGRVTRTFNVPDDTIRRMREGITEDQGAGRWLSDSAWCGEAISAAVQQAQQRNGGGLPTPPPRLPNRLKR